MFFYPLSDGFVKQPLFVIPAEAEIQPFQTVFFGYWIPAFAGKTTYYVYVNFVPAHHLPLVFQISISF